MNSGEVFAVFSYEAQQSDELTFDVNDQLIIIRKGDDAEREWWWARMKDNGNEGYVPRNLLGVSMKNECSSKRTCLARVVDIRRIINTFLRENDFN